MNMISEASASLISLPITVDLCIGQTLHHLKKTDYFQWNNLPDYVRRPPSLNIFKSMVDEVKLTTGVQCNYNFCT